MDRPVLDKLYAASPKGAFRKALAGEVLDRVSFQFLKDHVDDLDAKTIVEVLGKGVEDVGSGVALFVVRLAEAMKDANAGVVVDALVLAGKLDEDAWADLTIRLRGRIPNYYWYYFVDRVRGAELFNALNVSRPGVDWISNVGPALENRPEPVVVPLLESRRHDAAARAYALTLPVNKILALSEQLPHHFPLDVVEAVVAGRTRENGDSWRPPLPPWMVPYVTDRLDVCDDDEGLRLYEWLAAQPRDARNGDLFDIALTRFKRSPLRFEWHPFVGRFLVTGREWKTRGVAVIEFCEKYNRGFPAGLLQAALAGATDANGATAAEGRAAILKTIHDEAARVFVRRAETALLSGDWEVALHTLEALASLDPSRFIRGPIHHLLKIPNLSTTLIAHIEACEELARQGGKEPSEEATYQAFNALYGGLT